VVEVSQNIILRFSYRKPLYQKALEADLGFNFFHLHLEQQLTVVCRRASRSWRS
jgi:hypothetical protein